MNFAISDITTSTPFTVSVSLCLATELAGGGRERRGSDGADNNGCARRRGRRGKGRRKQRARLTGVVVVPLGARVEAHKYRDLQARRRCEKVNGGEGEAARPAGGREGGRFGSEGARE